jgi:hypothetical protein
MKIVIFIVVIILLLLNVLQFTWDYIAYPLFPDVISDEQAALEIGRAILVSVYGEAMNSEPMQAIYLPNKKAWHVSTIMQEGYVGGVAGITIREHDGKVMSFSRGM